MIDFNAIECISLEGADLSQIPDQPNGPILWKTILDELGFPAIIAGGAVRDYKIGLEPRDIDIFCRARELMPPLGFDRIDGRDERLEEYESMSEIDVVLRGEIAGIPVDLVGLNTEGALGDIINSFDFGLSRIYFSPEEGIVGSPDFQRDLDAGTVTLLLDDRLERSIARFHRFNERTGGDWIMVEDFQ